MTSKWGDALILSLLAIGVVLLIIAALMNLELLAVILLVGIALVLFLIVALAIVGVIAAIPLYVLKRGKDSEPGNYRLDDVRSIKEDEKK